MKSIWMEGGNGEMKKNVGLKRKKDGKKEEKI